MNWFISDTHFNDPRITPEFNPYFRPFKSVKEQNRTMLDMINANVGKNDRLFHVGDVSVDPDGILLLKKVKCKHRTLVLGNHDVDDPEKMPLLMDAFDGHVWEYTDFSPMDGSQWLHLNHYPTKAVDDAFNIVGHVHGLWKVQPNMINVGVDAWHFKPVSLDTIKFVMNAIKNDYDKNVFPCCDSFTRTKD